MNEYVGVKKIAEVGASIEFEKDGQDLVVEEVLNAFTQYKYAVVEDNEIMYSELPIDNLKRKKPQRD